MVWHMVQTISVFGQTADDFLLMDVITFVTINFVFILTYITILFVKIFNCFIMDYDLSKKMIIISLILFYMKYILTIL